MAKDLRQQRREMFGVDGPAKKSGFSHAGAPGMEMNVPNPGLPQGKNHQALNHMNFNDLPSGNLGVDGNPRLHPFMDSVQENDGRDGYISAGDVGNSGTRQGMMGFRGANIARDQGQVIDTDASQFDGMLGNYNGMQAMQRAQRLNQDGQPSYLVSSMGMTGSPANAFQNPQLQEPPTRMFEELGLTGVQSAEGMNLGGPNNTTRNA